MNALIRAAVILVMVAAPVSGQERLELLTLDEETWVTFYDVPSRRFRAVRDKFVQRNFEGAGRDLDASIAFLTVEANRALPELQPALTDVVAQLQRIRARIGTSEVTASTLDGAFARTHWLLAQHFFVRTLRSRDGADHVTAGHYLWATAHHIERAVLWSNARIDRRTVGSLQSMRDLASRLIGGEAGRRVYQERPLRLAARTIVAVGEHLDRTIRIEDLVEQEAEQQ